MWRFIRLWEQQVVFGRHPRWSLSAQDMNKLHLRMFMLDDIAVHGIEHCGRYAYAHPPLYDKRRRPELARAIWFRTIEWCCNNDVDYLDLGGLAGRDWPTLIRHRRHFANLQYKWAFVPEDVKRHPEKEPQLYQLRCGCGWKELVGSLSASCSRCASS